VRRFFGAAAFVAITMIVSGDGAHARTPATPPAAPAAPVPPPPAAPRIDQTPIIAFPGQYAPKPAGERFAVNSKSCLRFTDLGERLACSEFVLNDWPRLSRYAEANAALGRPKPGEKRVVFFGDSITDNWSKAGYGGFFPGKPYLNRGIGSQTTPQMLIRFRPDVVAAQPRVVVILAGTNDVAANTGPTTPEAIQANLASMVDIARSNQIAVVLASLLPTTDEKLGADGRAIMRSQDRPPETIKRLNQWMASYAREKRLVYLDYASALADAQGRLRADLTDDGLHPNAAGYAVMAPLAEKAIATALRR
jgi:lysophospholipase L1-like esterase